MHPDSDTTDLRAFTVILAGPNHLIGERQQVEAYVTVHVVRSTRQPCRPGTPSGRTFCRTGTSRFWKRHTR